jgi:preprotein translocase subunit SecA
MLNTMDFLRKIFGDQSKQALRQMESVVLEINALEEGIKSLSDDELRQKTPYFKKKLADGESLDDILPEAFAVVREVSRRTLGERQYDVQLIGGMVIHQGKIAEMRTGEGKTLVSTLPAYLNALTGDGVHIVTVNDYLARRDAVWMGQIYSFLGLSVGVINSQESYMYDPDVKEEHDEHDKERDEAGSFKIVYEFLRPSSRIEAYRADITYGTNNEFGFDYLRDNIEYDPDSIRQLKYNFTIVDEIDSILIDEARTPLIVSAPAAESENLYVTFNEIASKLTAEKDYEIDEKRRQIALTDEGIEKAEKLLGVDNIYTDKGVKYVHHLETAVRAKALFQKDKEYVVRDGEIIIVDQFTGRLQPGRRWSEGIHQAVEAKEGLRIQKESRTVASITFQNYFRLYKKMAGMTGTAATSSEEFYRVYGLEVVVIPTHKKIQRTDHNDLIFQTEKGKLKAIARKIKELNQKGQPVLVGTVSVEKNELLSAYLSKEGVPHELLNAKNHEREGEIIAQAGRKGRVMIATNMAGRGVDIKLGGRPVVEKEYEEVKSLGGLFVLGTERHEARRIDDQLRGRAGRQGDPGETQFFVSLEDSLMRVFASDTIKNMMGRFGIPEDEPIENKVITNSLESAQKRIEGFNFDSRKHTLQYDDVINRQRKGTYDRRRKILLGDIETVKEMIHEIINGDESLKQSIEEKERSIGEEEFWNAARRIYLQSIDMLWMEHLEVMDYTRSSVNLRAYGQKDPLVEYKKEGLRLYKEMQASLEEQVKSLLPNIGAGAFLKEEQKLREAQRQAVFAGGSETSGEGKSGGAKPVASSKPKNEIGAKIGRNDMVTIKDPKTGKEETMKYKRAEEKIKQGWKLL